MASGSVSPVCSVIICMQHPTFVGDCPPPTKSKRYTRTSSSSLTATCLARSSLTATTFGSRSAISIDSLVILSAEKLPSLLRITETNHYLDTTSTCISTACR